MKKNTLFRAIALLLLISCQDKPTYLNTDLTVEQRVDDLVSRMTVEEKISQLSHFAPAIDRLGVMAYEPNLNNPFLPSDEEDADETKSLKETRKWENPRLWKPMECLDGGYWNESLHGVARSGLATSFPQSIGLGSTWNPALIEQMSNAIGIEARVHNNVYGKKLTYWSPTINILRDPRWGRNEESYSEDPYLLSQMAVAYVKGLQGYDPNYLQAIATIKHFVANNSEFNRHDGSSDIPKRFLHEYYLPAFKAAIIEGGAESVMSAYNAINGVPASVNHWLLDTLLRQEWGFKGFVVSDCGAISDIPNKHKFETDKEKAVAKSVIAGTDLECETCESELFMYDRFLPEAFKKGYINEAQIDLSVKRLFRARMLLGEFDPPEKVPFKSVPEEKLDCQDHRDLALQVARESMVLLKNDGLLPLKKNKIKKLAVIGPNADIAELGGYSGSPALRVSTLDGIESLVGNDIQVEYELGCHISNQEVIGWDEENSKPIFEDIDDEENITKAVSLAQSADAVVLVLGTNLQIANEAADRLNLDLPGNQLKLAQAVYKANPNAIVVLVNGMSLAIDWLDKNVPAIVEAWYPGQAGGTAIADVLFGKYNPGGKLPVSFIKGTEELPSIGEYDISQGHSYWFYQGDVIYPFGHGLSYSDFEYSSLELSHKEFNSSDEIKVSVTISNKSKIKGEEVVQLYIKDIESGEIQPQKKLRKFERIAVSPGGSSVVKFSLTKEDFSFWSESDKDWIVEPGAFEIQIGSSSGDIRLRNTLSFK